MRHTLFIALVTLALSGCMGSRSVKTPLNDSQAQVVMLGIGAKNPTFDESRFPHLCVVYTPDLVSQAQASDSARAAIATTTDAAREIFTGQPALLATWWDELDLRNHAVFVDAAGTGAWQGWVGRREGILDSAADKGASILGTVMAEVIEDGSAVQVKGSAFDPASIRGALGVTFPDWPVQKADGTKTTMQKLIAGKPTLIVVFQIQSTGDLDAAKQAQEAKSLGAFVGSMMRGAASDKVANTFVAIEGELFDHDARN